MSVRIEIVPFLFASLLIAAILLLACRLLHVRRVRALVSSGAVFLLLSFYMVVFFRDPPRNPPDDPKAIVSAADGRIAGIVDVAPEDFELLIERFTEQGIDAERLARLRNRDLVRISTFLSLIDVHVNRAPIQGVSEFLGYFPGARHFTFQERASVENQHNAIYMHNPHTACLLMQIVGPVARRVVYWPDSDQPVELSLGEPIGMMKFGSRMDIYLRASDVEVTIAKGERVRAGETVIARCRKDSK